MLKKISWIAALIAMLAIVFMGCPTDYGKERIIYGPGGGGDEAMTTVFDLETSVIQQIPVGALTIPTSGNASVDPIIWAGNAGEGHIIDPKLVVGPGGTKSIQYTTGVNWGAGLDLNVNKFEFRAGDKIFLKGNTDKGEIELNAKVGSQNKIGSGGPGDFNIAVTLTAAQVADIKSGSPPALRLENRTTGATVRWDTIKVEGMRPVYTGPDKYLVPPPLSAVDFCLDLNEIETEDTAFASNPRVGVTVEKDNVSLSFSVHNQRAFFKLSDAQKDLLKGADQLQVTYDASRGTSTATVQGYIGNPKAGTSWNATGAFGIGTGTQSLNVSDEDRLGYCIVRLQQESGFPATTLKINSIRIKALYKQFSIGEINMVENPIGGGFNMLICDYSGPATGVTYDWAIKGNVVDSGPYIVTKTIGKYTITLKAPSYDPFEVEWDMCGCTDSTDCRCTRDYCECENCKVGVYWSLADYITGGGGIGGGQALSSDGGVATISGSSVLITRGASDADWRALEVSINALGIDPAMNKFKVIVRGTTASAAKVKAAQPDDPWGDFASATTTAGNLNYEMVGIIPAGFGQPRFRIQTENAVGVSFTIDSIEITTVIFTLADYITDGGGIGGGQALSSDGSVATISGSSVLITRGASDADWRALEVSINALGLDLSMNKYRVTITGTTASAAKVKAAQPDDPWGDFASATTTAGNLNYKAVGIIPANFGQPRFRIQTENAVGVSFTIDTIEIEYVGAP